VVGNVLKIMCVHFGASRIQCGKIKIGGWIPLPLAIHKCPSLSRVKKITRKCYKCGGFDNNCIIVEE
jgi:hypothetical protein